MANVNLTNLRLHDGEVPDDAYFVVIAVHEDVAYKIRYDVLTETLVRTVASTPITDADILFRICSSKSAVAVASFFSARMQWYLLLLAPVGSCEDRVAAKVRSSGSEGGRRNGCSAARAFWTWSLAVRAGSDTSWSRPLRER